MLQKRLENRGMELEEEKVARQQINDAMEALKVSTQQKQSTIDSLTKSEADLKVSFQLSCPFFLFSALLLVMEVRKT